MLENIEFQFIVNLFISLVAGGLIGIERESRGKSAGISTHCLVIGGSMIFTMLSLAMDPSEPARIAAQIVSGIGFLGAGIILREGHSDKVTNLTTAASLWYSASIGMVFGFGWYLIGGIATLYAVLVPRIPSIEKGTVKKNRF